MLGIYGGNFAGYGGEPMVSYSGLPTFGYPPQESVSNTTPSTPAVGSNTPAPAGNTLSMNLGGVNVNYDLGPSMSTLASQAGQFLNNSFSNDAAFLGQTIVGANSLVTNLTQPLINSAQTQVQFDNTQLPSFYQNLANQNFEIGQGAIAAESQAAQASIASSQSAASSAGGGCYITSAVCETFGLPDDCHTLAVLREFRDTYLARLAVGRAYIAEYYQTAPRLVEKIRVRIDAREYLQSLYTRFILPALLSIEWKQPENAFRIYRRMIYTIRQENP
jgi:hypothetical protein